VTLADLVLLAATMLIVIPLSVLTFVVLESDSPFGLGFRSRSRYAISVGMFVAAVWAVIAGIWPIAILLLPLLARRHFLGIWFRRRLGHRWSAVFIATLNMAIFALPLYLFFTQADLVGRFWIVALSLAGLLLGYGVAVFLLRSLAGEYDQTPAKTDVRPSR
jgi:hypothetical protein